jgi:hypothetical protein
MEEQKSNEFEDIRPYVDEEVPKVIKRLFNNLLFSTLFKISLKTALPEWNRWEINQRINLLKKVKSVDGFQELLLEPLEGLINRTTGGLTYSGLENVSRDKNHLFISNHRDIVMDPTLLNYTLGINEHKTTAIATGINLLNIGPVRDLMKLNKIVVIKRGINGGHEKFEAMEVQSRFIRDYIQNRGSVWIAQSEGRAKDGNDSTNSALIKMLSYAGKKRGIPLTETLLGMNVIPVSISYEYDPLDIKKAREISDKRINGKHKKWFLEDFLSMRKGLFGYKGRVHITFGTQITQVDSKQRIVADIDRQIITNYKVWPSNEIAYQIVKDIPLSFLGDAANEFLKRREKVPSDLVEIFDEMYANPLINKMRYSNQNTKEA